MTLARPPPPRPGYWRRGAIALEIGRNPSTEVEMLHRAGRQVRGALRLRASRPVRMRSSSTGRGSCSRLTATTAPPAPPNHVRPQEIGREVQDVPGVAVVQEPALVQVVDVLAGPRKVSAVAQAETGSDGQYGAPHAGVQRVGMRVVQGDDRCPTRGEAGVDRDSRDEPRVGRRERCHGVSMSRRSGGGARSGCKVGSGSAPRSPRTRYRART